MVAVRLPAGTQATFTIFRSGVGFWTQKSWQATSSSPGFASAIGNWGKKIDQPGDSSLAERNHAARLLELPTLGTKMVRLHEPLLSVMPKDRWRRSAFIDEGDHEIVIACSTGGCMRIAWNYGGMGWPFTLKMTRKRSRLNGFRKKKPIMNADRHKPKPWPKRMPGSLLARNAAYLPCSK